MTSNELKACPFCGGEATISNHGSMYQPDIMRARVRCKQCGIEGEEKQKCYDDDRHIAEAIAAWNTRTVPMQGKREMEWSEQYEVFVEKPSSNKVAPKEGDEDYELLCWLVTEYDRNWQLYMQNKQDTWVACFLSINADMCKKAADRIVELKAKLSSLPQPVAMDTLEISDVEALLGAYDTAVEKGLPITAIKRNVEIVRELLKHAQITKR